MKLLSVTKYRGKSPKRYTALFEDSTGHTKKVAFGSRYGNTYIDHGALEKRKNWIARHRVRENWDDPYSAGALSRWLLWEKLSLSDAVRDYKIRFGV